MTHSEIIEKLQTIRPGASWALSGSTYDELVWTDEKQIKPTKVELGLED